MRHLLGIVLLLFLGILALGVMSKKDPEVGTAAATTQAATPPDPWVEERRKRKAAEDGISIKDYRWSKSEFGIMTATFTFANPSDFDLKDIVVRCDHSGPSGTVIDSNTKTIFEIVPARSTKTVRNFNMGFIHSQAARSGCAIKNSVSAGYRPPPTPKNEKSGPTGTAQK